MVFKKGITLIELLVIIAILGIFSGIGYVSFTSIDSGSTLRSNKENLKSYIEEIKFKVKLEGIAMDFKLLGEKLFSGCHDLKYDKYKYLIFLIGFGIIILSESSLGYISNNMIKNILILILPIILILITYIIFIYKLKISRRTIIK